MSGLIKEINRSVKHLLLRKNDEEQRGTRCIQGNVYFVITVFSCLSSTKPCLRFLLICFDREIKGFHQSSLGNGVDFTDIINVSLNILAEN